jgi:hypothetical protein
MRETVLRTKDTKDDKRGYLGVVYDSQLKQNGPANAELTLTLKIFFRKQDPTPQGGNSNVVADGTGTLFQLTPISDAQLHLYREEACRQANQVWNNALWLVPPNEFTLFDWPRPPQQPIIRPNIKCSLRCLWVGSEADAHAVVTVVAPDPSDRRQFISFCGFWDPKGLDLGDPDKQAYAAAVSKFGRFKRAVWDIWDTGVRHNSHIAQDPGFWPFTNEDVQQRTIPHETGHLLGLKHVGEALQVWNCIDKSDATGEGDPRYGDMKGLPMWLARDIMGMGSVVHACNALPWMEVIVHHTDFGNDNWLPAGAEIPPRAIKDLPAVNYTQQNSPYQGGFQERWKY